MIKSHKEFDIKRGRVQKSFLVYLYIKYDIKKTPIINKDKKRNKEFVFKINLGGNHTD